MIFDYTKNLLQTILDAQANQHLHSDDWQRTIYIDTLGVKATEFKIRDAKKEALVKSGRKAHKTISNGMTARRAPRPIVFEKQ